MQQKSPAILRQNQREAIDFMYEGDETMLLADVGTGKTVIVLSALKRWMEDSVVERVLILAPKRVCTDVWSTEPQEWEHIDHIEVHNIAGATPKRRAAVIEDFSCRIVAVNYENLPWLMKMYPDGLPGFNAVIMDEVDKLKDHTTLRFKGTPRRNKKNNVPGMKRWRDHFQIHVGMTGTPTPNNLLELWAQSFVVDGGRRLGKDFYSFRNAHFYQTDWMGYSFAPLPGRDEMIFDLISDMTFRIKKEKTDGMPDVVKLPPRMIQLNSVTMEAYRRLERDYMVLFRRQVMDGEKLSQVEADDAGVLYGKLRQLSAGFLYVEDTGEREAEWFDSGKFTELDSLISELQGQQLMIVYHYQAQLAELQGRYKKRLRYLGGGLSDRKASETIRLWNDGELELLALHPQSAGHGLNLQKSGANHIAMLTLPESAGLFEQVVGRLARTGNTSAHVYVHSFLAAETRDEDQRDVLEGKIKTQADALAAMEKRNRSRK